jgi:hypothetical protein
VAHSGENQLFERYLAARVPDEDPDTLLERLLVMAQPVATRIVRRHLGSLCTPADAAELANEAMLELLSRLRALYDAGTSPPNFRFESLTVGVAVNTVHRFHARHIPERNRLRKKLRYLLETGERFRLWQGAEGKAVCALAGASEKERLASSADVDRCRESLRNQPVPAHPLATLLLEILRTLVRPIELSRLTAIAADFTGIQEPAWSAPENESGESGPQFPAHPAPSAGLRLELRERIESMWPEILRLPARQRIALLLSARTPVETVAGLLVDLGVTSFGQMAVALEMTPEGLAPLWNRLPLEDREIAARLGLERQQVINLRATARERLTRREFRAGRGKAIPI